MSEFSNRIGRLQPFVTGSNRPEAAIRCAYKSRVDSRNGDRVTALAGGVPVAVVNHPSSQFAYSEVNPIIAEQIERALARKAQVADFANTSVLYSRWCEATASALPTPGKHLSGSDRLKLITKRMESMAAVDEAALA